MRTKTFTFFVLFLFSLISVQAQYSVTLKVVDITLGERSNDLVDERNTDSNIYVWIDDNLVEQNPITPDEWWYPMYNNSGFTPDGNLIKGESSWEWTITLNVAPGEYEWNPHIKSYGWISLRRSGLVSYEGESENLSFTVSEDGTISGVTEIIIRETSPLYDVTLSIIDRTKGEVTNGSDELDEKNVYIWFSGSFNNDGEWWYPMYDMENTTGKLVKSDNSWTWEATFSAQPGTYEWNPYLGEVGQDILLKDQEIPGLVFPANEGGNLEFVVAQDGTITGTISLVIPTDGNSIFTEDTEDYQVYPTVFSDKVYVNGAYSSIELYDTAGIKVLSVKADSFVELNTTSLNKGIYFLVIDGNTLHKIIK